MSSLIEYLQENISTLKLNDPYDSIVSRIVEYYSGERNRLLYDYLYKGIQEEDICHIALSQCNMCGYTYQNMWSMHILFNHSKSVEDGLNKVTVKMKTIADLNELRELTKTLKNILNNENRVIQ